MQSEFSSNTGAASSARLSPVNAAHIPALLKAEKRWAPWRAQYQPGLLKFGKVPVRLDNPQYGLSSAAPDKWAHFEQALRVCNVPESNLAGVGFVMTGAQNLVGIDLDRAVADGQIKPWAREIVDQFNSYTEISPSGAGLRIFVRGTQADDWTNNEQGVEVYAGHKPRFLTVTGAHVDGTPTEVREAPPGALTWLATEHRRSEARPVGAVGEMPDLLPVAPEVDPLTVPAATVKLLAGEEPEDGSRALIAAAVSLLKAGMSDAQALTVLWHNPFTQTIAMRHRREDADRALAYLWEHHVGKARPIADMSRVSEGDFPDLSAEAGEGAAAASGEAFSLADAFAPLRLPTCAEERETAPPPILPGLLRRDLGILIGVGGVGKTTFVLNLMAHLALGRSFAGSTAPAVQRVALITREDARAHLNAKLERVLCELDASGAEIAAAYKRLMIVDLTEAPADVAFLASASGARVAQNERAIGALATGLHDFAPDLVVLDPLVSFHAGSENSNEDANALILAVRKLRRSLPGSPGVLMVHHAGKALGKDQYSARGASAFVDGCRAAWVLSEQPAEEFHAASRGAALQPGARALKLEVRKASHDRRPPPISLAQEGYAIRASGAVFHPEAANPVDGAADGVSYVDLLDTAMRQAHAQGQRHNKEHWEGARDGILAGTPRSAARDAMNVLISQGWAEVQGGCVVPVFLDASDPGDPFADVVGA